MSVPGITFHRQERRGEDLTLWFHAFSTISTRLCVTTKNRTLATLGFLLTVSLSFGEGNGVGIAGRNHFSHVLEAPELLS